MWTCRDPISLILGARIGSLKHLKKPLSYCWNFLPETPWDKFGRIAGNLEKCELESLKLFESRAQHVQINILIPLCKRILSKQTLLSERVCHHIISICPGCYMVTDARELTVPVTVFRPVFIFCLIFGSFLDPFKLPRAAMATELFASSVTSSCWIACMPLLWWK